MNTSEALQFILAAKGEKSLQFEIAIAAAELSAPILDSPGDCSRERKSKKEGGTQKP